MTKPVKKLFDEALANDLFWDHLKQDDPTAPKRHSASYHGHMESHMLVCVYQGWLMGRREFDESKYI